MPPDGIFADRCQALQNLLPVFALDAPKNRKGFPLLPIVFRFEQTIGFARPFSYTVNIPFRVTCAVRPILLFVERLTLFELLCFSRQLLYTDKPAMSNDLKNLIVFYPVLTISPRPDRHFTGERHNSLPKKHIKRMLIIFIRAVITFSTLLIVLRLMGKRQIGEMQPFELVITLLIAELACIPMADVSVPLIYGIAAIVAMFVLHQLISVAEQLSQPFKKIVSGKPALVLTKKGIDFRELKKNNMGVEDLIESMRSAGYFSLAELDYAIFESNGKLSAMEKEEKSEKTGSLPVLLIGDGKLNEKNRALAGIDYNDIFAMLKKHNVPSVRKTGVMTVDGKGEIYLQAFGKEAVTDRFSFREAKW